jgi:hypothetical protein
MRRWPFVYGYALSITNAVSPRYRMEFFRSSFSAGRSTKISPVPDDVAGFSI